MPKVTKEYLGDLLCSLQQMEQRERKNGIRPEGTLISQAERVAELLLKCLDMQTKPPLRNSQGELISEQYWNKQDVF